MTGETLPLPVPSDAAIRAILERRVDACGLSPGMVVGVTEAGRHRFVAHGRADALGRPVDERTIFEIGSVTKLFTAALLAEMAARGEAALDEPVAALLPVGVQIPQRNGRAITLAHLATHTSGLPRLPAGIDPLASDPYAHCTAERLYAFLAEHILARTPGEGFEYSNLGAGLLGHALALRAGRDYEGLLRARILDPLGMADTGVQLHPAQLPRLATGHDDSLDPVPAWHFGVLAGAGGLRSTASDLLRFLEALMDRAGPLGPAAATMVAPCDAGGLGFALRPPESPVILLHEGGTGGFRSHAGCVPEWRRGTVVLANGAAGAVADLGVHLCDPRWGWLWHRVPAAIDPACFDRLLGRYRLAPGMVFDVTRAGARLMVRLTGQRAYQAFPLSEWRMFYKAVGAQITFERGPDGRAARLILHQNSRDQIAERIG